MDKELIAYLDERFGRIDQRFEQVDKAIREVGVEVEGLRGEIKQVAEGVAMCNQRIDAFQVDVAKQFDELRQLFNTSHSNLHRRVSALEARQERRRT